MNLCFILPPPSIRGEEIFIPLRLFGKTPTIVFDALGEDFILCLSNQQKLDGRKSISIHFSSKNCSIASKAPLKAYQKPEITKPFNQGLKNQLIGYSITHDVNASKIIVSHYGPSEVYSTIPDIHYPIGKGLDKLEYFSIAILSSQQVEFINLKVLEFPLKVLSSSTNKPVTPKISSVSSTFNREEPPPSKNKTISLQLCKYDTTCELCHWETDNNPKRVEHMKSYRHSCKWGSKCKDRFDQEHSLYYCHPSPPNCPDASECQKIHNPKHRREYRHPGLWDFMVPCKNYNHNQGKCNGHDEDKYYH